MQGYPLTPMQEGMLFHHISDRKSGVDVEQIVCTLHESVDPECLQKGWHDTFAEITRLGTAFRWEGVPAPEQYETDSTAPAIDVRDLRDLPAGTVEDRIRTWLEEDRSRGFDLRHPPLSRLTLFVLGESEHRLVWTFPHILMDGRSFPIVLRRVFAHYDAAAGGAEASLPEPPHSDFRDFVAWYRSRDDSREESAWRSYLAGFSSPTPLPFARAGNGVTSDRGEIDLRLSLEETAFLEALAADGAITLNTIVQGAWGFLLARYAGADEAVFGATRSGRAGSCEGADAMVGVLINTLPVRVHLDENLPIREWLRALRRETRTHRAVEHAPIVRIQQWSEVPAGEPLFESLLVYDHALLGTTLLGTEGIGSAREFELIERTSFPLTLYAHGEDRLHLKLAHDRSRLRDEEARELLQRLRIILRGIGASPDLPLADLALTANQSTDSLQRWNDTRRAIPEDVTLHGLVSRTLRRNPSQTAVRCDGWNLTGAELDALSNRIARQLMRLGAGPGHVVGVALPRSCDMIATLLGVLKTGAAYLPLDPGYPVDRLAFMVQDSGTRLVVSTAEAFAPLAGQGVTAVLLDRDGKAILAHDDTPVEDPARPEDLAYVIYTSGSTGQPKGVQVEHRNVVNFLVGMDDVLEWPESTGEERGTWLSLTSLSFDISVLEIFWTLARGLTLAVFREEHGEGGGDPGPFLAPVRPEPDGTPGGGPGDDTEGATSRMEFSLFYFASDSEVATAGTGSRVPDRYRLLLEGARFADSHGFSAVWTPERHFHAFGGLYPNPSVTGAAVAAITSRVGIRAGSVVLPLHHPIRVAEEWSVVDNLSGGRVGLSLASGWHPNDFVLAPERYAERKAILYRDAEVLRRLWRGEKVGFPGPDGSEVEVEILPRPLQAELPIWITTAGSIETWIEAGRIGAHVLTHLLGQTIEELEERILAYRAAWQEAGHGPVEGQVSLMLHTFVGNDDDEVRELVRGPMTEYLRSSVSLIRNFADSWTAYRKKGPTQGSSGPSDDFEKLLPEDMEALLDFAFERYFETSGLFGSPDRCLAMASRLRQVGVSEIACLIDFGVDEERVLAHLPQLAGVLERINGRQPLREIGSAAAAEAAARSTPTFAEQLRQQGVTHVQCTPSRLRMLLADPESRAALRGISWFLVGGEALPGALASELCEATGGRVLNMYGPTETTIWSSVHEVDATTEKLEGTVPIGRPIANTSLHVLDERMRPLPPGVPGELFIGGLGVVRGYRDRPALDAERFLPDPFAPPPLSGPVARMYRTGDLVRRRTDGVLEFLGRTDHQVKLRGHRIELGEIEAALQAHPEVADAAVILREDTPGDQRLAAYLVTVSHSGHAASGSNGNGPRPRREPDELLAAVRLHAAGRLPGVMVPSDFILMEQLPLTPNRKVDRNSLPAPRGRASAPTQERSVPSTPSEVLTLPGGRTAVLVAEIWKELLGVNAVGPDDNFFDLGGHSLLTVRVHSRLREAFGAELRITDLFRYPTVRTLATFLGRGQEDTNADALGAHDRGATRRAAIRRRVPGGAGR